MSTSLFGPQGPGARAVSSSGIYRRPWENGLIAALGAGASMRRRSLPAADLEIEKGVGEGRLCTDSGLARHRPAGFSPIFGDYEVFDPRFAELAN